MDTFPLIILASDPMTHLPFTTLFYFFHLHRLHSYLSIYIPALSLHLKGIAKTRHLEFRKTLLSCSLRRWSQQKSFLLSLSNHSLLACPISSSLSAILSHMYFTLSFHLTTGLSLGLSVSLTYTFFTNSSFFPYDQTTSKYLFSPIPLHHTSFHLNEKCRCQ